MNKSPMIAGPMAEYVASPMPPRHRNAIKDSKVVIKEAARETRLQVNKPTARINLKNEYNKLKIKNLS